MMFPHTITVFRYGYDKTTRLNNALISRQVFEGALWEGTKAANVIKSGLKDADSVTVYVPLSVCGDAENPIQAGDYVVKGSVTYDGSAAELTKSFPAAVKVTSVDTFDFGGLQHYKISGS